jgi:hypothetical protein
MYTKITDITWASPEDQYALGDESFNNERDNYIATKIAENKTDGVGYTISNVRTRRLWIDQASAQDYVDFITTLATTYNANIAEATIVDNV